jgi:formylglycine-generating enzyme required for sulfatase activity
MSEMKRASRAAVLAVLAVVAVLASCSGGSSGGGDASTDSDTDMGSDTDTDSDADTETDMDTDSDPETDADAGLDASADSGPPLPAEWIPIPGGTYLMGSEGGLYEEEQPAHEVSIPALEMTKTEITVFQYNDCFADGECTTPNTSEGCNWGVAGRGNHPVNCVDVFQAETYCSWLGGRLPSESEWEYAARAGGLDIEYPWGDDTPSCDLAIMAALIDDVVVESCGEGEITWPVCSKPPGNTEQGLCDMAGNVWEWVPDKWHVNYYTAPTDGSVWEWPEGEDSRVLRGGDMGANEIGLRSRSRYYYPESGRSHRNGFRCARSWSVDAYGGMLGDH